MSKSAAPLRYFKEQFDDEEVLMVFRKHPVVMRKGILIASVGILLPMLYIMALTFIYANNSEKLPTVNMFYAALGLGFILAFLLMLPSWIGWYYSVYIVTNQRLIQINQKGLFRRSMVGFGLNQIQMINYEIGGVQETLLGFGTIMIQTYVGSLTIHEVHHPGKIQKELLHILREQGIDASVNPADDSKQRQMISEEDE